MRYVAKAPFYSRLGIAALSILAMPAFAEQDIPQGCIAELITTARSLPQAYSVRTNYCDGTVPVQNRAELQVVSFSAGNINFSTNQPDLYVKPAIPAYGAVRLLGVDKRSSGSYRLDAVLPPSGLHIDLASAVQPKGISSDFLGLVAWQENNGQKTFIPVQVASSNTSPRDYILQLRTPTPVIQAVYALCDGEKCGKQQNLGKDLNAGSLLNIALDGESAAHISTIKITVLAPANRTYGQVLRIGFQE